MNYKQPSENDIKDFCKIVETEAEHLPSNGSRFYEVDSFENLVKLVAYIQYCNKEYLLLFRGQGKLYTNKRGYYSFYPTIFRRIEDDELTSLHPGELHERENELENTVCKLKQHLPNTYHETILLYSIIQHYELYKTPLLDLTRSLQVAYSFGRRNQKEKSSCYIVVFGFPHLQGTEILYKTKPNIINVPLLSNCPPEFLRPHFQEAHAICLNLITCKNQDKCKHDQKRNLVAIIKVNGNQSDNKYCLNDEYLQLNNEPGCITLCRSNKIQVK